MNTVLKSFRLPPAIVDFLNKKSEETGESQTKVLEKLIQESMTREEQWKKDLNLMTYDLKYQKEQIDLAEEYYEN